MAYPEQDRGYLPKPGQAVPASAPYAVPSLAPQGPTNPLLEAALAKMAADIAALKGEGTGGPEILDPTALALPQGQVTVESMVPQPGWQPPGGGVRPEDIGMALNMSGDTQFEPEVITVPRPPSRPNAMPGGPLETQGTRTLAGNVVPSPVDMIADIVGKMAQRGDQPTLGSDVDMFLGQPLRQIGEGVSGALAPLAQYLGIAPRGGPQPGQKVQVPDQVPTQGLGPATETVAETAPAQPAMPQLEEYVPELPPEPVPLQQGAWMQDLMALLQADRAAQAAALDKYGRPPKPGLSAANIGAFFSALGAHPMNMWGAATADLVGSRKRQALENELAKAELNAPIYKMMAAMGESKDETDRFNWSASQDYKTGVANTRNSAKSANVAAKNNLATDLFVDDRRAAREDAREKRNVRNQVASALVSRGGPMGALAMGQLVEDSGLSGADPVVSMLGKQALYEMGPKAAEKYFKGKGIKPPKGLKDDAKMLWFMQQVEKNPMLAGELSMAASMELGKKKK